MMKYHSEVRKSIDASGCLPADLRYLNGNRICTLPGNHAGVVILQVQRR